MFTRPWPHIISIRSNMMLPLLYLLAMSCSAASSNLISVARPYRKMLENPCHLMLRVERLDEDGGERVGLACQLIDADIPDGEYVRIVTIDGLDGDDEIKTMAAENSYVLFADGAELDYGLNTLQITSVDTVEVSQLRSQRSLLHRNGRNLAFKSSVSRTENVLVVRVESPAGKTTANANQLQNDWFLDDYSLRTQYRRCSQNQMNFEPATGSDKSGKAISGGVYSLSTSNLVADNPYTSDGLVLNALKSKFDARTFETFDKIAMCLPSYAFGPGIAYAYINGDVSVYNDVWCQYLSSQMHEVAHNLGLAHAGRDEKFGCKISPYCQYDDKSGLMGVSYPYDDMGICFNGAKSWQLGWFSKYHKVLNAKTVLSWSGRLYGFYDLGSAPAGAKAIVRVECPNAYYYIHFNHIFDGASNELAPNYSSGDARNRVMVTRTDVTNGFSQSWWEYDLGVNSVQAIANIGGSGRTLMVSVGDIDTVVGVARVTLSFVGPPTIAPVAKPTPKPTGNPTKEPTGKPTGQPSKAPTKSPTRPPTDKPTSAPTMIPTGKPSRRPSDKPTYDPTRAPTGMPTADPTAKPTSRPTDKPTVPPTRYPTVKPTVAPTNAPSGKPTAAATRPPTGKPTKSPTSTPTDKPVSVPTRNPTNTQLATAAPTPRPTNRPTSDPTDKPTHLPAPRILTAKPTVFPTGKPSGRPSRNPTSRPNKLPTRAPTRRPTPRPTPRPNRTSPVSSTSCNYNRICEAGEDCRSCPSDCRKSGKNKFCCAGGNLAGCFPRGRKNVCFKRGRHCDFGTL